MKEAEVLCTNSTALMITIEYKTVWTLEAVWILWRSSL
jgi:hypothetical protein